VQKFLIVGCGGSGGSTLAYMMDQITSELTELGIDRIPAGWQFVHVDVPTSPDTRIPGIGNVFEQGGSYIATGPLAGSYSTLDSALSQSLGQGGHLEHIATWAPRDPTDIRVPITNGAGQMRAVGRAITLSRADTVSSGLEAAFDRLNTVEANAEMGVVAELIPGSGGFNAVSPVIVLVVSSMAGGAGASMALDVCRLLSLVPGVDPMLTGVFMVTPDVFDSLPEPARSGVRANALAMLGEIVATQANAAGEHDRATLAALGHQSASTEAPFKRVFPVGRFVGRERTQFGNGSQTAVYRGLGRGLAALMTSGAATHNFVSYDLVNALPEPTDRTHIGWGTDADNLQWGAFGFASLSMGRDRYRYYAAQRLARASADRLTTGHLQQGNAASSDEQVVALLDSQWSRIAADLGLPAATTAAALTPQEVMTWFTSVAFGRNEADGAARAITEEQLVPFVPIATGAAAQWLPSLRTALAGRKAAMNGAAVEAAYRWSFGWSDLLHKRILAQVALATAQFGLPYARKLVERIDALVREQLLRTLGDLAGYGMADNGQIPTTFEAEVAAMRGAIGNGQALVARLVDIFRVQTTDSVYARSADAARGVLLALTTDVLAPLRAALTESLVQLEQAARTAPNGVGLANVSTNEYSAWPSDDDVAVPSRFGVADNEILLTASTGFDRQFEGDLQSMFSAEGARRLYPDARAIAVGQIVSGEWPVVGGAVAPAGLLEILAEWRPAQFNQDPFSGAPIAPSRGRYSFHVNPAELVGRALAFVKRTGEPFDDFCSLSLSDYAQGTDILPSQLASRRSDIAAKFGEALSRALPLISVNDDSVTALHGKPSQYFYKFSAVPFANSPDFVEELVRAISARASTDPKTIDVFGQAISEDTLVTKIDIFGSYRNYSPLVFDSLLTPVAKQWAGTPPHGRKEFWSNRRSRPLTAALPMGESERRAMVAGWYIGQLTSQIRIPEAPYEDAVEIWDPENGVWAQFPNPLLTPPSDFVGLQYDWLPAVMESSLLALSRAQVAPVMSSIRPYRLLRELFDATRWEPASGLGLKTAQTTLARWLATGLTPSGLPSRVTPAATMEGRYTDASAWLGKIHDFTGIYHLPPNRSGAPGTGSSAVIRKRSEASATPIFRDLAQDIYLVTSNLVTILDEAREEAIRNPTGAAAIPQRYGTSPAGASAVSVPEPDFGVF